MQHEQTRALFEKYMERPKLKDVAKELKISTPALSRFKTGKLKLSDKALRKVCLFLESKYRI